MIVYVVRYGDYDDYGIYGIYATEKEARDRQRQLGDSYYYTRFEVGVDYTWSMSNGETEE